MLRDENIQPHEPMMGITSPLYAGLELLSTAVLIVDRRLTLRYANPAAENLFAFSCKSMLRQPLTRLFPGNAKLFVILSQARDADASINKNELTLDLPGIATLHLFCVATPMAQHEPMVVLEFRQLDQQLKIAREEKILEHQQLNRELIRNLAHEIKNPLGGIRGSAQLLERELTNSELKEYTHVIVKEADRLRLLMDRLLTPSQLPQLISLNIHEVLERVRTLILAEFPGELTIRRDYDTSLPDVVGDKERLVQALLNVARNAAQAMQGHGEIQFVTRIARQITLARQRYRHAIIVQIIDNGPGVPQTLQDKIFYPLVSGREGGTGMGLSLAQDLINQHHGIIEFDSIPGKTCFTVLLPVPARESDPALLNQQSSMS